MIPSGAVPELVIVTSCWLLVRTRTEPKATDGVVLVSTGAAPTLVPVPASATVSGEWTPPVEATLSVADRWPAGPGGLNCRPIVQVWSRVSTLPAHRSVPGATENMAASVPVTVAADGVTEALSRLVTVTVLVGLVLPTATPPKSTERGSAASEPASLPATVNWFVVMPVALPALSRMVKSLPTVPPVIVCSVAPSPR